MTLETRFFTENPKERWFLPQSLFLPLFPHFIWGEWASHCALSFPSSKLSCTPIHWRMQNHPGNTFSSQKQKPPGIDC